MMQLTRWKIASESVDFPPSAPPAPLVSPATVSVWSISASIASEDCMLKTKLSDGFLGPGSPRFAGKTCRCRYKAVKRSQMHTYSFFHKFSGEALSICIHRRKVNYEINIVFVSIVEMQSHRVLQ